MGPVQIIDTPGIDDEGTLGELRVRKTKQILNRTDVAVLIVDGTLGLTGTEKEMIDLFTEKEIPYLIVLNKSDLFSGDPAGVRKIISDAVETGKSCRIPPSEERFVTVSAVTGEGIQELKERIARLTPTDDLTMRLVGDLLEPSDFAVLVVPIDSAAPKGRLILPQQQTIRDVLEAGATAVVVKERDLKDTLASRKKAPHSHHRQPGFRLRQR